MTIAPTMTTTLTTKHTSPRHAGSSALVVKPDRGPPGLGVSNWTTAHRWASSPSLPESPDAMTRSVQRTRHHLAGHAGVFRGGEGDEGLGLGDLVVELLAEGGSFAPDADDPARATLTLQGVWPHAVYFTERPERRSGTRPVADILALPGQFTPQNPHHAAVALTDPENESADVVVVELRDPVYDAAAGTLQFGVTVLDDVLVELASWEADVDGALPASFGGGTVFFDPHISFFSG